MTMLESIKPEISLDQYFGIYANHPDASAGKWSVADMMLEKVNALLEYAVECGIELHENPQTKSLISGTENGGFRPNNSPVGAPLSDHKRGRAVDIADVGNYLYSWITDEILVRFHLYREAPTHTPNWCHLQDTPPKSGKRTFLP